MKTIDIYQRPPIPTEILSLSVEPPTADYDGECEALWKAVCEEFFDTEYVPRSHHSIGTYNKGCRGPLCRKANREHPRRASGESTVGQLRYQRIFDPVLEYFHTVLKYRVRLVHQQALKDPEESETVS